MEPSSLSGVSGSVFDRYGSDVEDSHIRWALITGASSQIGQAVAIRLAGLGFSLALQSFRHPENLVWIEQEAERLGVGARSIATSLHNETGTKKLSSWVATEIGQPELVIWLSASGTMRPLKAISQKHLDWTFRVSAFAPVLVMKDLACAKLITVSSLGANRVVPDYAAIGSAKAALDAMVRYLAVELAPETTVFGISAGLVETPAAKALPNYELLKSSILSRTPMGRLVTPQDVASTVAMLALADASMATGSIINLDGGMSLVI